MSSRTNRVTRLDPKVNRILYVRNLPFKITADEIYDLFGRYGALRQVRVGNTNETKGTAFIIYEDIFDAKQACEHLTGFNVGGRYLTVLYYQPQKSSKIDTEQETKEINLLKKTVETNEELIKQEQGTTGNTNTAQDDNISLDLEDDERERNYRNKRR